MAVFSFVFMPMVLLASAVLLTGGQITTITSEMPSKPEPYVVAIHKRENTSKTAVCTGAMIKYGTVLTTATCIDRAGKDILVSTTSYDNKQNKLVGNGVYEVLKFIKHPKFNSTINMIDLAILKLKKEISDTMGNMSTLFVTNVGPMQGASCINTHWVLQSPLTQLSVRGKPTPCANADTPFKLCANFSGEQACMSGSEGGVLACNGKVVGIFSEKTGNKNCTPARLGFVDVTKHYDWINMPEVLHEVSKKSGSEVPLGSTLNVVIATTVGALFLRF